MAHRSATNYVPPDSSGGIPRVVEVPEAAETLRRIEELLNVGKGKQLDDEGREVLDPRPLAPPIGYVKQPSMVEHIRNLVRSTLLQQAAEAAGSESFEDADDFEVDDELDDPRTPYEAVFDPPAPTLPEGPAAAAGGPPKPPETLSEERCDEGIAPPAPDPTPAAGSKAPPTPSKPPRPPNTPRRA